MDWQLIEHPTSVPMDRDVFIFSDPIMSSGSFEKDANGVGFWLVRFGLEDWFDEHPPTHWSPLPSGPIRTIRH